MCILKEEFRIANNRKQVTVDYKTLHTLSEANKKWR